MILRTRKSGSIWAVKAVLLTSLLASGVSLMAQTQAREQYPRPAYPRYLVKPSKDRMLQAARIAVRQVYGRSPLGKIQSGQTVHAFLEHQQDMAVWEAVKQAWAERGVKAFAVRAWELPGMTETDFNQWAKSNLIYGKEGWKELGYFEPDYIQFFSADVQKTFGKPLSLYFLLKNVESYLDKHPEIERYFMGIGGRGNTRSAAGKHQNKFVGNWVLETENELLSKFAAFPGDVWSLVDDRVDAPKAHVSEGTFTDAEGTNLHWTLTPEETKRWAESNWNPGHLSVYPSPPRATWKPGGVVAAASNHTGYQEFMKVFIDEHGRVMRVEGGGRTGDLFRTLVEHPKFKNAKFPSTTVPGYWYLNADGFGTNPKAVRDMDHLINGSQTWSNMSERNRAGVQHFSYSHPAKEENPKDEAYANAEGLPLKHTMHMHTFFSTVRWKLADTGEWITVSDKGWLKAFDDPEVRALAAKYGDPKDLFRYEWIPAIPGVNVAGEHERDYGKDPWGYLMKEWAKIQAGTYEYYVDDYASRSGTP
ncbi:MAG: hypothetical protein A3F68_04995 [Acidobacteria bacterium RIFCSPLOWO2_12_FULL_54_10]|nr:MAG: hypothetical protein A3F68_04995 [Acidobacteria bacterium RIFCSPLOWO2_12_FULL_54_10]